MYLARPPVPALTHVVDQLWYCEQYNVPHRKERVLPAGRFQIVIDLAETSLPPIAAGLRTQYEVLDTRWLRSIIGIVFQPGGVRAVFHTPASEFFNQEVPLECVWGKSILALRDRLREAPTVEQRFRIIEGELCRRLADGDGLHPAVRGGLQLFHGNPHIARIASTAKDTGLSRRRFAHLFSEQVGMPPKLYCRLLRFRGIVQRAAQGLPVHWADVALAGGYSDQAHMAHEFRDFSGISLSTYMASQRPFLNHVVMEE